MSTAIRVIPPWGKPVVRPLRRPATVSVHVVRVATRQSRGDTLFLHMKFGVGAVDVFV